MRLYENTKGFHSISVAIDFMAITLIRMRLCQNVSEWRIIRDMTRLTALGYEWDSILDKDGDTYGP